MAGLDVLPAELLYEIQICAASSELPHTSRYLYQVFKDAPLSFHADYILARVSSVNDTPSRILRYPLCSKEVLEIILRKTDVFRKGHYDLPKRLFRALQPRNPSSRLPAWSEKDRPLPFLQFLYEESGISPPNINGVDGYGLTRAVHSGFTPLIHFLLRHGANPSYKDGLAVQVAIRQKNLPLVRSLIERDGFHTNGKGKRRKLGDRMRVTPHLLRAAVKCDARDIVEYFTKEKGCIPDMTTLEMTVFR